MPLKVPLIPDEPLDPEEPEDPEEPLVPLVPGSPLSPVRANVNIQSSPFENGLDVEEEIESTSILK